MKVIFNTKRAEEQFSSKYIKKWKYPQKIKEKLVSMEDIIGAAESLHDIANHRPFHFHSLTGDRDGEWSLDVDGRRSTYRVIIIPCDDEGKTITQGDIMAQCKQIKVMKIMEVSKHYE